MTQQDHTMSLLFTITAVTFLAVVISPAWALQGEFLVCGPFELADGVGRMDVDYLAEAGGIESVDPQAGVQVGDGPAWKRVRPDTSGRIDLLKELGVLENVVGYVACRFTIEQPRPAMLKLHHDDGAIAYLNGSQTGRWGIGERTVPVQLRKGTNLLVMRIDQGGGGWYVSADIVEPVQFSTPVLTPNGDGVNDTVTVELAIASPTSTTVQITDQSQKVVRTLPKQTLTRDNNHVVWDGKNDKGTPCPQGHYAVTATVGPEQSISGTVELRSASALKRSDFSEVKSFVPFGVFYDGNLLPGPKEFDAQCRDLKAHHMNMIHFTNLWLDRTGDRGVLDKNGENWVLKTLAKYDMKAIMGSGPANGFFDAQTPASEFEARRCFAPVVDMARRYPAMLAYYLYDEPSLEKAHKLGVAARVIEDMDGIRPGLACLIGLDRIKAVYQTMQMPIMLIDPYAIAHGSELGDFRMTGFGYKDMDLGDYIDYSRDIMAKDARLWTIIQTHNFQTQLREPTPAEVLAMSWISLARGSTGFIWFVYQSQQGWRGLVHEGTPTERYKVAAEFTKRIGRISSELAGMQYLTLPIGSTTTPKAEVQTLRNKDSNKLYIAVVNRNVTEKQTVRIKTMMPIPSATDITGVYETRVDGNNIIIDLEPGDGALLLLK